MSKVEVLPDSATVANWVADALVADLADAIVRHGQAIWVAAGGSTPAAAYDILAQRYAQAIAWESVTIVMGDERCVPVGDADSNSEQLSQRLLRHDGTNRASFLRPRAELGAERAASEYADVLASLDRAPSGSPRLDHVWLGMGEDGHTLSLFPNNPALDADGPLVAPVFNSPKPPPNRVTLTFDALKGANHCLILATGVGKRDAVTSALSGDSSLPVARAAQVVESSGGQVTWVLDAAAADRTAN